MHTLKIILSLSTLAVMAAPSLSEAAPNRRAPLSQRDTRVTEVPMDRYHTGGVVVRERTAGKRFATFWADPLLIDPGAAVDFEIRSVSKSGAVTRWRCTAETDVAECLGVPVKIRYLPKDQKVVLTAWIRPSAIANPAHQFASR